MLAAEIPSGTITVMLQRARSGDVAARDQLFGHVYKELKQRAQHLLDQKRGRWSEQEATSLVGAACARLLAAEKLDAENRRHFFFLLSRAMQDVLVEQARHDLAAKRGGGSRPGPLQETAIETEDGAYLIIDVRDALVEFRKVDERAAEIVMLKYYGGRTLNEIAEIIGCTFSNVRDDWEYARAWLHERLSRGL